MKTRLLLLVTLVCGCSTSPLPPPASARYRGATLHLQIVDTVTGAGIPHAIVSVTGARRFGGATNQNGDTWIFGVPRGTYNIAVLNRCPFERREPASIAVGDDSAQDFRIAMSKHSDCVWPDITP